MTAIGFLEHLPGAQNRRLSSRFRVTQPQLGVGPGDVHHGVGAVDVIGDDVGRGRRIGPEAADHRLHQRTGRTDDCNPDHRAYHACVSNPSPFDGLPFLKDIFKFLSFDGAVHWEMAKQLAVLGATGGESETNPDPLQRIRLEELIRVADLRVADATGLATSITGGLLTVRPVTRAEWALRALDDWKDLLEGLAISLGQPDKAAQGGAALEQPLGDIDPMHPESLQEALGDPEALLGAVQTDEQRALLARIDALVTPIIGYVDHVLDTVGRQLIGSYGSLHEALRRRQLAENDATRFLARLLGPDVGQRQYDRGSTFG